MDDITIFISACDRNIDLLPIFFEVIDKQWPEIKKYPFVINTETQPFYYNDYNITCPCVCIKHGNIEWSERLCESMKHVNTKYVLFLLDDFMPAKRVNHAAFISLVEKIKSIKRFACVYFCEMRSLYPSKPLEGLYPLRLIGAFSNYKAQMVPGLWDKSTLVKLVAGGGNIWETELSMTRKSYFMRGKYFTIHEFENTDIPVYLRNADSNPAGLVFDYKMQLVKGKWVHTFEGFFRELCVRVDYGKRGFAEFPYNLSEAQSVMDQRDAIDRKGKWSLARYQFIHNCLIPSMSRVKYRIYNWFQ